MPIPLSQARFLLSPDPEFSQVGTVTRVNYLQAFRKYHDMIFEQSHTPAYQVILSSFNVLVFGKDYTPVQSSAAYDGDEELEDEIEDYRRRLKQTSELPPDPPNVDTDILSPPPSVPVVTVSESHSACVPTPTESETEDVRLVTPQPKARPAPTKKVASTMDPSDPILKNPAPGNSTPEVIPANPGRPARGNKNTTRKKKATAEQPVATRTSRRAQAK